MRVPSPCRVYDVVIMLSTEIRRDIKSVEWQISTHTNPLRGLNVQPIIVDPAVTPRSCIRLEYPAQVRRVLCLQVQSGEGVRLLKQIILILSGKDNDIWSTKAGYLPSRGTSGKIAGESNVWVNVKGWNCHDYKQKKKKGCGYLISCG